jgi:DNA polymerase-2
VSDAETARGFILQPTYRIEAGRPVVHLFGVLEGGGAFLVRDGRDVPRFWVETADADLAALLGAAPLTADGRVTMGGEPVVAIEVPTPSDTPPLRDRLLDAGVACFEADVRFAIRYLIDRGVRGTLAIRGAGRPEPGVGLVFDEPEVGPDPAAEWTPRLSTLSFDIETDPRAGRLLSIALDGCGVSEVLLFTPEGYAAVEGAACFPHERELIAAFCRRVREIDPDVVTGWNVADFDFPVLARLARRHGVPLELGRAPGTVRLRPAPSGRMLGDVSIPGRVVLDGLALVRGAFLKMDSYALDAVAREVLGEGKIITGSGRAEEILRLFKEDRPRLVAYNLTDARLVTQILDRLQLVELAVARSRLTGLPPDRVAGSIAAFDFLYLSELGRRRVVAPSVARPRRVSTGAAGAPGGDEDDEGAEPEAAEATAGGHVLDPLPGLYDRVLVFDFKSLYPSLIRSFEIDPLGHLPDPAAAEPPEPDPIVAPNGAAFRRRTGILTELLDRLVPARRAAQRAGDRVASYAIKILMNSFYGVLGTPACRFHTPATANAITSFGKAVLLWSRDWFEARGQPVLYGDTDSLFVASGAAGDEAARRLGETLAEELNRELSAHLAAGWRVESRLELAFERLYLKLVLPPARHGGGARKRYAGLAAPEPGSGEQAQVVLTGMEAVRSDWTELARRVQRELYERLFLDRPVEEYLKRTAAELRAGALDDLLVYRKALRKPPSAYTATTPPHVAAARKLARRRPGATPRRVSYVITVAGPEPHGETTGALDYEHYVDKQLRPVAEPVLALLGLDFARVIGDDRQMELF